MLSPRLALLCLLLPLAACQGSDANPDALVGDDVVDAGPDGMPPPDGGPSPDSEPEPQGLVQCPQTWTAATEGSCDATDGTGTAVLVRGNVLGEAATYLDGEVLYDGDLLVCRGCDCSASAGYATASIVTCAGAAVSPGLINAHDHITFNNAYPLASTAANGTRYVNRRGWRGPVSTPSNQAGIGATSAGMRWNELRHIFAGTTSNVGSGRANNLMRNLDDLSSADTALGFGTVEYQTFILGDRTGSSNAIPANCGFDYVFDDLEVAGFPGLITHTGEGLDAYSKEELRCVASQMAGRDFVENNVGHIHGIAFDAANYFDMARDDASFIWSPRSNIALYGNTAEPQVMKRVGGNIALGTDWTFSGSATLPRELACADEFDDTYLSNAFTDEELWRMVTINAARATQTESKIGSLEPGKIADLAVFRAEPGELHGATIGAWSNDVLLTVRDGDVLFGEADVIAALDGTCETLDVCGAPRRVCTSREVATTYVAIKALIDTETVPVYPAILCEADVVALKEPTCLPTRVGEYTGAITVADPDGDGLTGAADNCPDVFNPIRSVDGANQADVDADDVGDACDPTPIGADLDGDTVTNLIDVCPFVDDNQTDGDGDGKGAACEICDDLPNPDGVCVPLPPDPDSIVEIQNGTLAENTSVYLTGVVVTSVLYNGFTVQDPTVANGQYAGVFAYTNTAPSLVRGEIVSLSGKIDEFNGLTELIDVTIMTHVSGGTVPTPIALTAAAAAAEMYEGVLVRITDVATINTAYSCTVDNASCADTGTWLINNAIVAWDASWEGTDPEWAAEGTALTAAQPLIGVMTFRWNRVRICPRITADIGS